ncbi:hypothetical protein [Nocardia alni]|uniref:hypothetical protein n=1 Tax=Nocardia alni TaxID=2815723 RepID=UPI001C22CBFF|nr:hypothetical protein [Nocardia alni]
MEIIEFFDRYADAFEIHTLRELRAHLRQARTERNQSATDPVERAWLRCNELGTAAHLARSLANSLARKWDPERAARWRIRAEIILAEADRVAAYAEALEDTDH